MDGAEVYQKASLEIHREPVLMSLELKTDRFNLKPVGSNDIDYFLDLDSDPEVMRYLTNGVPSTREQAQAALDRVATVFQNNHGKFGVWLAFTKDSGDFVGWVLFRPCKKDPSNTDRIELGYRLKRKWWRQGVGTELSRHMLNYGFNTLKVSEIFAITALGNIGSQGVMKKIGMSFVKEYLDDEIIWDDKRAVLFRLLRNEFRP